MRRRAFVSKGLGLVGSTCITGLLAGTAGAQNAPAPANTPPLEEVVVTGLRASIQNSTNAKREATGFVDSIFAEDIGKFPDTNIAESFNRIPGIMINREITGEGLQVAIRGLNTNFTRVLLNNAPVAIASTPQDQGSVNREVDLDLFPTELFSQLTVAKTPTADMVEGGAAGTINMRMARPFDREGTHLSYSLQGIDNAHADGTGGRGALVGSDTFGNFGVLVGITGVRNKVATTGFETVGWTSMALTQAQCGVGPPPAACNATGGAGAGPGSLAAVPDNASTRGAGLNPGDPITQAFLLAHNPGATIQQIDNGLIPRLGRPMFDVGTKDRYNGVVSLEFRPTDDMHFFLDSMYGRKKNDLQRVDMMWGVRRTSQGGLIIPLNMQFDKSDCSAGCTVTSATFPNSQFLLEYRPYTETTDFWGTNPGMSWQFAEKWNFEVQGNYTKSRFHREDPTVLLLTGPSTVTYTNDGGIPSIVSSLDLNNPANFQWAVTNRDGNNGTEVGRTDMVDERRQTNTKGGRLALTWGDADLNIKVGGAYDTVLRDIRPLANSQLWQNGVCGGSPAVNVLQPNTEPGCRGQTAAEIAAAQAGATPPYPTYTTYAGSLIPNAAVPNYLSPTKYGFVSVNWDQFRAASNYDAVHDQILDAGATPTTASWGSIEEDVTGLFSQVSGQFKIAENHLRYNAGVRWARTEQSVTSRLTRQDPSNVVPGTSPPVLVPDGTRVPDVANFVVLDKTYSKLLPDANVAWNVTDDFILRAGLSKTMTRANPSDLLLGLNIRNADVSQVNLGNPDLDPYMSDNIDLGFEYYTGREGYFGVAAFRKGLEGFTTQKVTTVPFSALAEFGVTLESLGPSQQDSVRNRGGQNAPVQLSQTVNASGRLTIDGLEFNWVQPLDFLLDRVHLGGFGFTANYTIIDQHGKGAAPAIAIGVPPATYNATLYYEKHGVSARVSITSARGSQSSGPNSNQQQVTGAELFANAYKQWDFSSSFDFATLFGWSDVIPKLTVDAINFTNEKRRSYFQFNDAAFTEFDSGRTIMVGLRGTF